MKINSSLLLLLLLLPSLPVEAQDLPAVMPANVVGDTADPAVSARKVEAGLALALDLTARFEYIPSGMRDSLIAAQTDEAVTTLRAAQIVDADIAVFANSVRVANLVRSEVSLRSGDSLGLEQRGVGYAAVRHYNDSGVVADPAILTSLQRALCVALDDNTLYASAPEDLMAIPSTLVGIGGIAFKNDSSLPSRWKVFEDATVVSYDIVINLVHALQEFPDLTVVDLDTRDSMFAMGGLMLIENDRAVSNTELRILRLFEVGHIITGSFERNTEGALLTLHWCRIEPDGRYTIERSAEQLITEDSAVQTRDAAVALVQQLLADEDDG